MLCNSLIKCINLLFVWSYIGLQDCLKSIDYQFLPNGFNCIRSSTVCVTTSVEKEVVVCNYMVELVCSFRVLATGRVSTRRWPDTDGCRWRKQAGRTTLQDWLLSRWVRSCFQALLTACFHHHNSSVSSVKLWSSRREWIWQQVFELCLPENFQMFITHSRSPNDTVYICLLKHETYVTYF